MEYEKIYFSGGEGKGPGQKDKKIQIRKGNAQDLESCQANSNRGERSIETIASLDQNHQKTIESNDLGAENHLMVMVE